MRAEANGLSKKQIVDRILNQNAVDAEVGSTVITDEKGNDISDQKLLKKNFLDRVRYCVFLLTLFLHLTIAAQTFTGKIIGEKGDSVSGATIMALDKSRHVVAYSIANGDGTYKLFIPDGKSVETIEVNNVGYQKKSLPRSLFKDGLDITLKESSFLLKEVKVKAQRIQSTGDTITYSVAGFKQAQDRSIADVIAKMPGLEVKADGKIEYQGNAINKFYKEGIDLMGAQYGMG